MTRTCLIVTPEIRKLTEEIRRLYPEASQRAGLTEERVAEWVGAYNTKLNKPADFCPDAKTLVDEVEKWTNMDGKSFKDPVYSIEYTPTGKKRQKYTIRGNKIFNKDGKEVFVPDSKDRRRIFVNLAVQQGRAVVVTYKDKKYVVNNRNQIISAQTGDMMKWGEENGDRKEVLRLAQIEFRNLINNQTGNSINNQTSGLINNETGTLINSRTDTSVRVKVDRGAAFEEMKKKLSKAISVGRSGYMSVTASPNDYNGAPVITVSVYNSGSDMATDEQYRLTPEGNLEARFRWSSDEWKDDWQQKPSQYDAVNEFFETLKKAAPTTNTINEPVSLTPQLVAHLKDAGINVFDRAQMEKYLKEHPNTLLQQALEEQWEMQDIKAKAIADGTFMKAPNGKSTNLTERQWLQVRTKNFINWFGDWINNPKNASKVVDENDEPLVMYHGTNNDVFSTFDLSRTGEYQGNISKRFGNAAFFSEPKDTRHVYKKMKNVIYVFLNVRKPFETGWWESAGRQKELFNSYKEDNPETDGVLLINAEEDEPWQFDEVVVFNANQIKSATNNNDMFSTENDDIQMAIESNKKLNNSLNIVDKAIETGNWSNEASDELDNLIEEYNNGRNEITQILGRSLSEGSRGSEAYAAASIILGRSQGTMRESNVSESAFEEFTRKNKERRIKENALQHWAQKNGWWWNDFADGDFLDDYLTREYGEKIAEASESIVHLSKDGKYAIKATSAIASEGDLLPLIQRIELHNQIFTNTPLEIIGFGKTKDGNFRVILQQPFIVGEKISASEAVKALENLGVKNNDKDYSQTIFDGKVTIKDVTNPQNRGNILKSAEGNYFVIDADITYSPSVDKSLYGNPSEYLQFFTTPEGEIYGFVDKYGNMYLDETIIDASHPIHEYTHLWDRALEKNNPKLWKKGVKLMQEGVPGLWNEISKSEKYGKLWQSKGIKGEKLVNLIASEVHARLVGENGAKLLDQIAKEKGGDSIVAKLKQWILDAWKALKATFSDWTQEEIDKLTLADFNHMTVRDFAEGINPNNIKQGSAALEQFKKEVDLLAGYYEGGGRVLKDDYPTVSDALDDKLADYFLGDGQLTIKDYRELYKVMHPAASPSSSTPSNAAPNVNPENADAAKSAFIFGEQPTAEQQAAAQQRIDEARAAKPEKPKPERPKSVAYESALDVKDSRVAQFNRTFSPQQIKDRGAMISEMFSKIIEEHLYDMMDAQLDIIDSDTATEKEKQEAKVELNRLKDPVNGRQYAAEDMTIPAILDEIKQQLEWDLEAAGEWNKTLWQNTIDFFTELFNTQATLDIEEREGIRIIGLEEISKTVSEEENDGLDNGDDEVGHVVSGSDGWNFQVRYTNPFDSLSRKVRSMLYEVHKPESEKDDLGQPRNYPMGQIYASLLAYLSKNMQNSDDFLSIDKSFTSEDRWGNEITETSYPNGYPTFPVLEEMKAVYPWVQQIIDRLTDDYLNPDWNTNIRYPSTGGSMASQFYTNFRKAYIPYGKVQLGDGKFGITPLNYEMEERAQLDKLEANYNNRMILTEHSIYDSDGKVNKENAKWLKKELEALVADMDRNNYSEMPELMEWHSQHPEDETLTQEDIQEYNDFMDKARMLLQSFGIDATRYSVAAYLMMDNGKTLRDMLGDLGWIATTITKVADDKVDSFNYMLDTRDRYGSNLWAHFFDGRGLITDASYMQSFYDSASKKTKYSYSADNYLMKTFRGACMGTMEQRRAYIDEHFGKFEWFRNQKMPKGTGWRNAWLEYWYNYPGELKEIPYRNVDNVTDYSGEEVKIRQYSKWEPDDVWQVQNRSYEPDKDNKTAFYLAPIFSDSPMSMTVKGPKMSMEELLFGTDDNGQHKQGALVQLVNQELWRIGYVQQRAKAIEEGRVTAIANFDGRRGQQFCFLPELNSYVFEDTGESFLDRMMRLKAKKVTMAAIEASEIQAIQDVINSKMGQYQGENYAHYTEESIKPEQYYNMVYANAAIIQMTTVDLAFYNDDTDFQKRFKEVYAGGIQLNTNSKYGKKTENIILLADDIITSPSYDKIAAIIDGSNLSTEDKSRIKATFQDINVADAQAFRSMHSFRSVLDMMGNWTDEMENALNHFKQGEWSAEDFDIIYQTIKPFVYSVIERNDGFGSSILVPQQNKNSEICALMMYDLITNGLNDSPVYKALSRFMEENVDGDGNHLIDMIQYESAGKVGNQGVINISFNPNKVMWVIEHGVTVGGEDFEFTTAYKDGKYLDNTLENAEENYKAIKEDLDNDLKKGVTTQEEYNKIMQYLRPTEEEIISMLEQAALVTNPDGTKGINPEVVHTIPFDNYYQQQPTPEHHIDAEATFGSQTRNIIVADLPDDMVLPLTGKGGKKRLLGKMGGKGAIIDFYYELLNENLLEDFFGKGNKKGLKDIFASKEALRDAVTEIVRGNPKYGRDFADALQLDDKGNFVLSPNSPTIFSLMQEIVTSFFKNRITKQTINGAALIQAAGIGLDENLRLEFDKNGNLLGAHCLMPLTSKRFFEPLLETQIINGKEVKVLSPEKLKKAGLDKAIGYRIPTENKSSIMPLIIDGFTPLQNGSAIVLPAEITNIAGSDFDVDKMFIMLLSFYVQNYDMRKAREDYAKEDTIYKEIFMRFDNSQLADEILDVEPDDFRTWFEENKDKYEFDEPIIRKIEYDFDKSPKENGRKARNNMIIQMMYGILTSKAGSESVMNPQGFPNVKRAAKVTRILTDKNLLTQLERNTSDVGPGVLPNPDQIIAEFLQIIQDKYPDKYDEYKKAVLEMTTEQIQEAYIQAVTAGNKTDMIKLLMDSSTKDLEKFIKDYSAPESPVYPQTFAHSHARNMAGANQIGIYAIQVSMDAKFQRATERLREEQQFMVNGRMITNVDVSDEGKRLKNVGQMIGASADNGKDPNLSDMGSTTKTAPMIGYMLRTGLSHLEAALIINQPIMKDSGYNPRTGYFKWEQKNYLNYKAIDVTTDMLIRGLISPFELTAEESRAIGLLCYKILLQHEAQEYMTQVSRADSPNGAMKNSYAKARIQRYKVDLFQAKMGQKNFPFVRITEALSNTAIDTSASEDEIRQQLKGQSMAFLHGMYALGINSFNDLVNPYFVGAQKWFDDEIVKPILYNLSEWIGDEKKEQIVNNIYTSYITYILSGSPLFGNEEGASMKSKRNYYLESFPSDYQKIIQENEDIRYLLSSVLQVKQFGNRKRVILQDVGSLSKGQKQDVQRRFESLINSDNPEARKLAADLFMYSYYDNGLQFTHNSFSHLFTTRFLTNFPVYNETLLELDNRISEEEETNFIHQFLLTYPEAAYNVNTILKGNKRYTMDDSRIMIDLNDKKMRERMVNEIMSPNPQFEGINVYPYIQYNGEVYVLDKELFDQYPGSPLYRKLDDYQTFSKLPLFSRQMSVVQMAQEFPVKDNNPQEGQSTGPAAPEAPMAHNEGSGDPNVGPDSMYDSFASMGDSFDFPDPADAAAAEEKSPSDTYQNEGEGELKDPFCPVP